MALPTTLLFHHCGILPQDFVYVVQNEPIGYPVCLNGLLWGLIGLVGIEFWTYFKNIYCYYILGLAFHHLCLSSAILCHCSVTICHKKL